MTAVGIAVVAAVLVAVLVKGKQVRFGSLVIGVLLGVLISATPVGPAAAKQLEAAGTWVWAKVSQA